MPIEFNGKIFSQRSVICDIGQDGILGQDFLLRYVSKINYKHYLLHTDQGDIQCQIYGKTDMTCRIEVRRTTIVPPHSGIWLPVDIPGCEGLTTYGYAEPVQNKHNLSMIPGVLDLSEKQVSVVNCTEEPITLHAKQHISVCESYIDSEIKRVSRVNETAPLDTQKPASAQLPDHLQDLFNRSSVHLDASQREVLAKLILDYQQVFAKSADDLGHTNLVQHTINTGSAIPVRQPMRRQPLGKRDIEREEIQKMLKRGVIEPSSSPWNSNVVLVTKKDGSVRFCVDYRVLNSLTKKDAYPLPRVDDCLDSLAGCKWYSTMDLNSGFWQVGLSAESRERTAFSTSLGLFHFILMPFGLVNSPSTFERLMETVLRGLQWVELLVYMDDILSMSKSFDEGIERLAKIFERLIAANLKLKPSKCTLFQRSAKFLGFCVLESGISTDEEKTAVIRDWPPCTTAKQCRSFLGLASYYRRYCPGFAEIAKPLHRLCQKGAAFKWTPECQVAFDGLKKLLTNSPVLGYPLSGQRFILDTDASQYSVRAVLSQVQGGNERVIAYMSKSSNEHEQKYCTTRRELLAVIMALKTFHHYVYGQEILLRTDNIAVSWLRSLKAPTGQVARWLQQLETYNITAEHRPGKSHVTADALSRRPCKVCQRQETLSSEVQGLSQESTVSDEHVCCLTAEPAECYSPPESIRIVTRSQQATTEDQLKHNQALLDGWQPSEIRAAQLNDNDMAIYLVAREDDSKQPAWNKVSSGSSSLKTLWRHWDRLVVRGGMLYREFTADENSDTIFQLIVPANKRGELIKYLHDIPSSGHLGAEKTLERAKHAFYWPAMKKYIENYCMTCDQCVAKKLPVHKNRAPLGQYLVGEPMERVALDITGPLPLSKLGNWFILVAADSFTKWTEAYAIPDQEANTIIRVFVNEFVSRFGTPLQIHSDRGTNFTSQAFREMCDFLKIDKTQTPVMRPQSNGNVERFNRTLQTMLTAYCEQDQRRWDEYLPQVMMAYRSSVHATTQQTPNKMVFGRDIVLPMEAVIGRPFSPEQADGAVQVEEHISKIQDRLETAHRIARRHLKVNSEYQKRHYDIKAKKRSLFPGQAVWLADPTRKKGVCTKLSPRWKGPFLVIKKLDDLTYLVKKSEKQRAAVFHLDRLEPYQGRNIPTWFSKVISKF